MSKRVLIFSIAYYPTHVGGAEVAIKEITDRIAPEDIQFHMVTLRFDRSLPKVEQVGNVLVHRIGFTKSRPSIADLRAFPLYANKMLFQFLAAYKAHRLHKKYHYDAVWAMMAHGTGVPAGLFKTWNPKVPYLLTLQEGDPIAHIKKKMLPLWPLFVRGFTQANFIQPISTFLATWARGMGYQGPVSVVPNAVDTAHFSQEYSAGVLDEIKDKLGKKTGDVFIVTTSRLVHKNAVDEVIRALEHLPENVHFIVLGIGPDEEKLRKLAADLRVTERVQFLGQVDHADLPKYLKVSDIFIRPSRSEGMGNSFVEAMAAGLPVIATQEGGIADFLFDEKRNQDKPTTGFAVDKDASDQIVEAVKYIMEHPEKVRAVVATAKEMVMEKYDWDIIARDMRKKVFEALF